MNFLSLKFIHTRHERVPDLKSPALLALADDMCPFLTDVHFNVLIHKFYFCQGTVEFTGLSHFYIGDAVLLQLFQEQVDIRGSHRSVLVSNVFLEKAVHQLFGNTFHFVVAFVNVMNVVSEIEESRQRCQFHAVLNFLRNQATSHFRIDEHLTLLPFERKLDALAALESDNLLGLK